MTKQESIKALTLRSILWSMAQHCIYQANLLDAGFKLSEVRGGIVDMRNYWHKKLTDQGYEPTDYPAVISLWHCTSTSRAGLNCKLHTVARELAELGRSVASDVEGNWKIVGIQTVSFEAMNVEYQIDGSAVVRVADGARAVIYDTPNKLCSAIEAGRAAPCLWVISEQEPEQPKSIADLKAGTYTAQDGLVKYTYNGRDAFVTMQDSKGEWTAYQPANKEVMRDLFEINWLVYASFPEQEPEQPESIADLLPEFEQAKGWEHTACGKQTIQEIEETAKLLRGALACDADSKGFTLELEASDTSEGIVQGGYKEPMTEPEPKPASDIPKPCGPVYYSPSTGFLYRELPDAGKVVYLGDTKKWRLSAVTVQSLRYSMEKGSPMVPWLPTEMHQHGVDIETKDYELVKAELLSLPFVLAVTTCNPYKEDANYSQVLVTLTHDMPFKDFEDAVWQACPNVSGCFRVEWMQ